MPIPSTVAALTYGASVPPSKAAIPSAALSDIYLDDMQKQMRMRNAAMESATRRNRYEAEKSLRGEEMKTSKKLGKEQMVFSLADFLASIGYGMTRLYGDKMDRAQYDKMIKLHEDTEKILKDTLERNILLQRNAYNVYNYTRKPSLETGIQLPALGM